ncbi:MAG: hypothetical protein M9908_12455 [Phyllobacteriaceae bacterium]|nr:hypothetical protein [Phyllobacteriaceae bacterium]
MEGRDGCVLPFRQTMKRLQVERKMTTGHYTNNRGTAKAAAILLAAVLAGCNSAGTNNVENTLDVANSGQSGSNVPARDAIQDPRAYCPQTVLRAGTETYDLYPKGVSKEDEGASSQLRFRATISEIARECNSAGEFLNIRVGVRGRFERAFRRTGFLHHAAACRRCPG